MNKKKLSTTIKEINKYFDFLYEKGYNIRFAEYSSRISGNWIIEFVSNNCAIYILNDRSSISIEFSPVENSLVNDQFNIKNVFDIGTMMYFISKGEIIIGGFRWNLNYQRRQHLKKMSELLEKYIDAISPYFGDDFESHKGDLMNAQSNYEDSFLSARS
jgi:hypothetical protein